MHASPTRIVKLYIENWTPASKDLESHTWVRTTIYVSRPVHFTRGSYCHISVLTNSGGGGHDDRPVTYITGVDKTGRRLMGWREGEPPNNRACNIVATHIQHVSALLQAITNNAEIAYACE